MSMRWASEALCITRRRPPHRPAGPYRFNGNEQQLRYHALSIFTPLRPGRASLGLQQPNGKRSLRIRRMPQHEPPKYKSPLDSFFAAPESGEDILEEEAIQRLDSEMTSMFLNSDPKSSVVSDPHEAKKNLNPQLKDLEHANIPPGDSLSSYVRHAMRSIPQSVVVVTSTDVHRPADPKIRDRNDRISPDRYRGMTVSSFNTVSLDPFPIVSFNIKVPSATHDAITNSGKFIIHTLSTSTDAIKIADHFSKGRGRAAFHPEEQVPFRTSTTGPHEPPLLDSKEIINPVTGTITFPYAFKCKLGKTLQIHDHVIVTAEIVRVLRTPRGERLDFGVPHGEPVIGLSYADGVYRQGSYPAKDPSAKFGVGNMPSQLEFYLRKLRQLVDPGRKLSKEDLIHRIGELQLQSAGQRALESMVSKLEGDNGVNERDVSGEEETVNEEGEEAKKKRENIAKLKKTLRKRGVGYEDKSTKIRGRGLDQSIRFMKTVKRTRYSNSDAGSE